MMRNLSILKAPIVELRHEILAEAAANPVVELDSTNPFELRESDIRPERDDAVRTVEDDERDYFLQRMENAPDIEELQSRRKYFFDSVASEESLQEHLLSQISCARLSESDAHLAEILIGNINEDGYFVGSLPDIEMIERRTKQEVLAVLHKIRDEFDPPGVGAQTLSECLLSQLQDAPNTLEMRTARAIIQSDLDKFTGNSDRFLMEKYGLSEQSLKSVREIIRTLDPKPGRVFSSTESLYIAPEVRVVRAPDGSYIAEVESDLLPKVRISKAYRLMANDGNIGKDEKRYLKAQIRAAKALMDGLSMRSFTLKAIAQAIVDLQPDFWSKGFAALRPMTMADVAIRAGVHKTTVSRTVAGKYLRAPRGIFPMRSFFTASLEQEGVGQISNRAVLNRIAAIIKSEDRMNPLSDDAIAAILRNEGIDCARRTVMKYRTKLQIPSSRERKRTS